MAGSALAALQLILGTVAGFFSILFLLRFFMQLRRVSFGNQLGGFVMQLTNWAVKPLRRIIPGVGGYDWASLVSAYLIQLISAGVLILVIRSAATGPLSGPELALGIMLAALIALLRSVIYMLIAVLLVATILSWVQPYSPLAGPLNEFIRPILAPIRRILPPISGIDLSPMVAFLLLQVILMFL